MSSTFSRGLLSPLPRSPSLEREAWVTLHTKMLYGVKLTKVERTILKIALKLFARKVFGATFFQKGSAVPTAKLGHNGIKFEAAYPDGITKTKTPDD